MKASAISRKIRPYIPKDWRGQENPPTYQIRTLRKEEVMAINAEIEMRVDIRANAMKKDGAMEGLSIDGLSIGKMMENEFLKQQMAVKKGCSGWANVVDADGEVLEFSPDNIPFLDGDVITELGDQILGKITEQDAGNSGKPSSAEPGSETRPETAGGTAETAEKGTSSQNVTAEA